MDSNGDNETPRQALSLGGIGLKLLATFSTTQLLAICSELGIDGEELGSSDDSRRFQATVVLLTELAYSNRIGELLDACNRHQPGSFSTWWTDFASPPETWLPRTLSEHIVRKLDEALRVAGKPYVERQLEDALEKIKHVAIPWLESMSSQAS